MFKGTTYFNFRDLNYHITEYHPKWKDGLFEIMSSNVPDFFAAKEIADFALFLESNNYRYFLIILNDKVVAGGGIILHVEKAMARICWDMVARPYHGKGLGTMLLNYRIHVIQSNPKISTVEVHTSQLAWKYYKKHGFKKLSEISDYWAPGFDLVLMNMTLPKGKNAK